ncbi:MAG TPA: T9SS type A sorting domain-containing protein [Puia sp.]|nr:T9SS type A sorting domain-containing protein [Puia sp.]
MKKFYPRVLGKLCLALLSSFLFTQIAKAQIRTYDTTFDGWNAIVTEDLGLHGNDSAPGIIFFPGIGQQTKNIHDLQVNGPHYLIKNGMWDGSVPLGNGVHHPFIISLQPPTSGYPASVLKPKIDAILARYRIKRNSLYFTGLSLGSWQANEFITYQPRPGDHTYGRMIRAMVNLEGVEPADYTGIYASLAYPGKMGDWAKSCGGRELWIEGANDWRAMDDGAKNMNAAVPGSATYFKVNYGGGAHCCWNTEYNPSVTWTTASNKNIVQVDGQQVPMNVWQWLLRQGDTSMPGNAPTALAPVQASPNVSAGTDPSITLPTTATTLAGTAAGSNGAKITAISWQQTSGPATAKIASPGSLTTAVSGLTVAGNYVFRLTVTDKNGKQAAASVNVVVHPAPPATPPARPATPPAAKPSSPAPPEAPPTVNAGSGPTITLPTSTATLNGSASGANGAKIKSVAWQQSAGPVAAKIASPASPRTAVSGLTVSGKYQFRLTVTDQNGKKAAAVVNVTVDAAKPGPKETPAAAPTVSAGAAPTISLPTTSTMLKGSATGGNGSKITGVHWQESKGPAAARIVSPGDLTTEISGLTASGDYIFRLTVTDQNGKQAAAVVTVVVNPPATKAPPPVVTKAPPVVNAGPNQTITLPTNSISLKGSARSRDGGIVNSYFWVMASGPGWVKFSNEWAPETTVSGLVAGTYVFELEASDNYGETSYASMTVIVKGKSTGAAIGESGETSDAAANSNVADSINHVGKLVIYPNPVQSLLNIHLNNEATGKITVAVFNMRGSRMLAQELDKQSWSLETSMDVSRLAAGMYVIEIISGPNLRTIDKFVKD